MCYLLILLSPRLILILFANKRHNKIVAKNLWFDFAFYKINKGTEQYFIVKNNKEAMLVHENLIVAIDII